MYPDEGTRDCVTGVLVCPPKPCPEAIKEVFHNKFHIIGAVGIGIAVVMVSVPYTRKEWSS